MTEAEKNALAMANAVWAERGDFPPIKIFRNEHSVMEALCRAIEAHEAFKREVSEAVGAYMHDKESIIGPATMRHFSSFIIPKPVDPLVEALCDAWPEYRNTMGDCENEADKIRQALAARGLQIVEANQ